MKIVVTGGAGFQGSHFVEHLLKEGHKITVLNTLSESALKNISPFKNKITAVWGSVTDKELVEKTAREHDLIIHLAARIHVDESIEEPLAYLQTNVVGTYNILEAMRRPENRQTRLIYWSTCEVYGEPGASKKLSEQSPLNPQSPYAASKAAADRLCYAYFRTYGVRTTIVRFFNIFGERQKAGARGALIPTLVERAIKRQPLLVSGSGKQTRDYTYIDDVVKSLDTLVNDRRLDGQVINFASGKNTSIIKIANYVAKKLQAKVARGPGRPGEVMAFPANIAKAQKLGFKPKISIWEGIDRYITWRLQQ